MNRIERYFNIDGQQTTLKTEIIAGITTFLTMSYIIFANPSILADAGMDKDAVFFATCMAAAIGCAIMGIYARLPIALAPGMGLNAFFTHGVVLDMGYDWQTALGAVFLSGCIFMVLGLFNIRLMVINAIPQCLKQGIVAGIGAFMALIALKNSGIIVANDATFVTLGNLKSFPTIMAALGFFLTVGLVNRKMPGAVTVSFLLITVIAVLTAHIPFAGVLSLPSPISPTFLQLDIYAAFDISMISVVLAFLFVDLFDTSGTLLAVTSKANLVDDEGNILNLDKALFADSSATIVGSLFGTSSTTSFIESAAGVAAGGRTGLTSVTVAVLFLLSVFFSPLASMVPTYATAGAIFYVSVLMLYTLKDIDWEDLTEAAPTAVVLLLTPLTYSIADGMTLGFITYTFIKLLSGKYKDINTTVWILTLILIAKITFLSDYF